VKTKKSYISGTLTAPLPVLSKAAWRNGRVVDCGGLENRCPGDWTGGSNPSFSAKDNTGRTVENGSVFVFRDEPNELVHEVKT
jgi:hypothetical protein